VKYFDVPKYRIRPRPERFLMDKLLVLLGLGVLFYLSIYVNYYLLNSTIPTYLNVLFIISIILLVIMELILCYVKYGNYAYEFYEQRLVVSDGKTHEIPYSGIKQIHYSTNFLDKQFNTGSIVLEMKSKRNIKLKYLDSPNQAYTLMQRYIK
jgi:membrane protein YdbS with pleckstrin-like domain